MNPLLKFATSVAEMANYPSLANDPALKNVIADAQAALDALSSIPEQGVGVSDDLQRRVTPWMQACFGPEISNDRLERGDRFIEEALELLQSGDYPRERVTMLLDYVYGREKGEPHQEVGGVMITLAAYCLAHGLDMHKAGEDELARIWTKVDKIRAKQAAKPTGSALPVAPSRPVAVAVTDEMVERVSVPYDGFSGDVIGSYITREGKQGVVVQQDGTRVVHVYGRSRVEAALVHRDRVK